MEFEGQYLSYQEYQQLGGTLAETSFNLLEYEARKQIDIRTQRRLVDLDQIPNEVKLCVFNLINKIVEYSNSMQSAMNSDGSVASESTDGYSISYNQINATQIQQVIQSKNVEFADIIMTDLYGVIVNNEHLIYNGVK